MELISSIPDFNVDVKLTIAYVEINAETVSNVRGRPQMTDDEKIFARDLARVGNAAIEQASTEKLIRGVNWADLGVRSVQRVEELTDRFDVNSFWRILIEEASPDASELHRAVYDRIKADGRFDGHEIEVSTEW